MIIYSRFKCAWTNYSHPNQHLQLQIEDYMKKAEENRENTLIATIIFTTFKAFGKINVVLYLFLQGVLYVKYNTLLTYYRLWYR